MPLYESTFVTRQDVSRADVNKLVENFSDIVTQNGGTVVKHEYWGLRNLAYKIKKNRKGHYVMLFLDAPFEALREMERNVRLHEDVIRNLTVSVDAIEEGPSAMMQKAGRDDEEGSERGDRSDRPERSDRHGSDRHSSDRAERHERSDRSSSSRDAESAA